MRRLRILTWHIHGSYLYALTSVEHDWYLPVSPPRPGGYGGKKPDMPGYVHDVPEDAVRDVDLDLIIFQSPQNYREDQDAILSPAQRRLPRIYIEHNAPRPHPVDTRHVVDDPSVLLVHVTHYNRLMWNNNRTPTVTIEHSVAVDPSLRATGELARGITVCNGMPRRARIAGRDIFLQARERVPLDLAGMQNEGLDPIGNFAYRDLHALVARYRFLFSPMRYTSLPLAVIEALTLGLPVVALATTEVPLVIEQGVHGYVSCDPDELVAHMRRLLDDPAEARHLGDNARELARRRFGMDRFRRDWNRAFQRAAELAAGA